MAMPHARDQGFGDDVACLITSGACSTVLPQSKSSTACRSRTTRTASPSERHVAGRPVPERLLRTEIAERSTSLEAERERLLTAKRTFEAAAAELTAATEAAAVSVTEEKRFRGAGV